MAVAGGAGDNAATACGLGAVKPGDGFLSLGTSGVLFSVTDRFATNTDNAVHSFCHAVPGTWHQMGVILCATDALAWFGEITVQPPAALSALVEDVSAPSPITFLPYLSGERTPHNAPDAADAFHGLRRDHALPDMVQAIMEGVGYAFADCCAALQSASSLPKSVTVAGGGSQSDTLLQMNADITGLELQVPKSGAQGAALGAARLAILACDDGAPQDVLTAAEIDKIMRQTMLYHRATQRPKRLPRFCPRTLQKLKKVFLGLKQESLCQSSFGLQPRLAFTLDLWRQHPRR